MKPLYRSFQTQQELDVEYDIERSVPDFSIYADHYVQQSEHARRALKCELNVRYGATLDEYLDIFSTAGEKCPVVLFIHGGYWRMLSSKEFSCVAMGPVSAGTHLLNVNYSLAPKVTMDEIVRQVRAAIAWAYQRASDYNGDRDRIYLVGHSAGAQLAAMALIADWTGEYDIPGDVVKGALLVSGLYDLRPLRYTFVQPSLQLTADQIERNSPILQMKKSEAKIVVTVGGEEPAEFQRQSREFIEVWQAAGNDGDFFQQPDKNHFNAIYGLENKDSELCRVLSKLMK